MKLFFNRIFVVLTVLLVSFCCYAQKNENIKPTVDSTKTQYNLFSDGKTEYVIAISEDASESELWAAKELQHWLKEISNANFDIVTDLGENSLSEQKSIIRIGFNQVLKTKLNIPEPAHNDESFRYFNDDSQIFIYGGKQRGTMYGVMTFLEKEFGCRWYSPLVTHIPQRDSLSFTRFEHSESPGIRVRNDFFYPAFDPVWAARNKMNGRLAANSTNQPGGYESYWGAHTFFTFIPPEEFFQEHPEYFSLINGVRKANRDFPKNGDLAQLCLSNPDVLRIVTERVLKTIQDNPNHLIYCVSQNDWYNACQCEKCSELVDKYGGTQSGILIWFVNQVAEVVEKEFPDKYIGTLAYQYTRPAPQNITPRRNVVIRLCPIEACVAHSLETCPKNKTFLQDMKDWAAISDQLYIWDYVVNFAHYMMPYPNFGVLQPNIQTFAKNKAIGVMEQGSYQGYGGEFQELKSYLISKLLWNPESNVDEIIDDFMTGYYGNSAQYIRQYFDLVQKLVKPQTHVSIGLNPNDRIFSDKFINQSISILNNAVRVADNDNISKRVDLVMASVLYLKSKRAPVTAKEDGTFDKFLKIVEVEKINVITEGSENLDTFKTSVNAAKKKTWFLCRIFSKKQ